MSADGAARERWAVLLAGGSGTRFWPLSRRAQPKQLLRLVGEQTMLRTTFDRIAPLCPPERVLVVTAQRLASAVAAELPELPAEHILGEPAARNTAAAVGWATSWIQARTPNAIVAVLAADHHLRDEDEFRATVDAACRLAEEDKIVCLGVTPTRAETGYGYLEVSPSASGTLRVVRFIEKPSAERARSFVAQPKRYKWNSGTFFFPAGLLLSAIDRHLPELGRLLKRHDAGEIDLAAFYSEAPAISLDHGVMEREPELMALPLTAGWSDVGSWEAWTEVVATDAHGNGGHADIINVESQGCLAYAPGKTVALLGVRDLVVVDTPDAILVCPREMAQRVREVVDALAAEDRQDLL